MFFEKRISEAMTKLPDQNIFVQMSLILLFLLWNGLPCNVTTPSNNSIQLTCKISNIGRLTFMYLFASKFINLTVWALITY